MRVGELMRTSVVTSRASDSCHDALARMYTSRIRHLPVVDEAGGLVGIVTGRDLRHLLFAPRIFSRVGSISIETMLRAVPVGEIMSSPVVSVSPAEDLGAAARVMLERKVGSLPVVEAGRLVGILTETDMLRQVVHADSCCCPDVEGIVVSYA